MGELEEPGCFYLQITGAALLILLRDNRKYVRCRKKGYPLNLGHFLLRAIDSGDWNKKNITKDEFRKLLTEKINSVNMNFVKADIPGS